MKLPRSILFALGLSISGSAAAPADQSDASQHPPAQQGQTLSTECAKDLNSIECTVDKFLQACKADKKSAQCIKSQASGNICDVDPTQPICLIRNGERTS